MYVSVQKLVTLQHSYISTVPLVFHIYLGNKTNWQHLMDYLNSPNHQNKLCAKFSPSTVHSVSHQKSCTT